MLGPKCPLVPPTFYSIQPHLAKVALVLVSCPDPDPTREKLERYARHLLPSSPQLAPTPSRLFPTGPGKKLTSHPLANDDSCARGGVGSRREESGDCIAVDAEGGGRENDGVKSESRGSDRLSRTMITNAVLHHGDMKVKFLAADHVMQKVGSGGPGGHFYRERW